VEKARMLGQYHYARIAVSPDQPLRKRVEKVTKKMTTELLCIKDKRMRAESAMEIIKTSYNKS